MATAIRLRQVGWEPVIVERATQRRTGGYFVLLWGSGRASAERLGMGPGVTDRSAPDTVHYEVDRRGNRIGVSILGNLPNGPRMMRRNDVENAAFQALPDDVEIRFSTVPTAIEQDADGVDVTLHDTASGDSMTERFGLVIGADGLRSTVRRLVFGPHERYMHPLGGITCAFQLSKPLPGLAQEDTAVLLEPDDDRAMWVFGFQEELPTVMLTYRTKDIDAEFHLPPAERLRQVFGDRPTGKLLGAVLDEADKAEDILFDSAEQVHMDSWHQGRVVLVGDSAWCVTLYAGMGVSAGLAGADLLGSMLLRHPDDLTRALTEWQRTLRPSVTEWQGSAEGLRQWFNPSGRREMLMRFIWTRGEGWPVVGRWVRKLLPTHQGPEERGRCSRLNLHRLCWVMHPFVRAVQDADAHTIGLLTEREETRHLLGRPGVRRACAGRRHVRVDERCRGEGDRSRAG
ncbi:2-polyprenyl-6-methoxyphenol hydroxylase [Nonomuraea maritima]|uniref:2-polyprenyl-6-methoxyphenol hydroxylase n=2 Tax=Nonomuraea maritima TaxID=683260 RepID=A0A1G9F2X7_9ACTN|nr:2-polyprenyl-6-methoxyphenol hydroxylase [Nonomuraea maritima]